MSRILSIFFSVFLIISFTAPLVMTIIEEGNGICHVDFGDENEKKENQESEKEKIYVVHYDHFNLTAIKLEDTYKNELELSYKDLFQDIFLPPPKLKTLSQFS